MDTSETYIKMCDKAVEIQQKWQPDDGQFPDYIYCKYCGLCHEVLHTDGHNNIWLPRQDQLQAMIPTVTGSTQPSFKIISELNHFYDYWDTHGIPDNLASWEQLWLAFVMKEKYNKVWNGDDWIKTAT